jgi:peroxiredoxin
MLAVGQRVPDATVWSAPGEGRTIAEIAADGRVLLLFYLFDWSST